jgi:hypothetical protein
MNDNNIRLIVVSATIINEINELHKWGNKHHTHYMTVPESYIGHKEFLAKNIIQEYYPIHCYESAEKWIKEDIKSNYESDYRVHIIRTDEFNKKFIQEACMKNDVVYKDHNSIERIEIQELNDIFSKPLSKHIVIAVKGLFRRANLIPNSWKLKIGATHERFSFQCDINVQVQGFPGRMSGYWREDIENGHKTGPHRTSVAAIYEYEEFYNNPYGNLYSTNSASRKTFLSPHNIKNLIEFNKTSEKIPVIVEFHDLDILTMTKIASKIDYVKKVLSNKPEYKKLLDFINVKKNTCLKIFQPKRNSDYKVYVLDIIEAADKNIPFSLQQPQKMKEKNNWQMYIDNKGYRLCFIICCDNDSY